MEQFEQIDGIMKDIEGYEGLYRITSCGRVWSYRSKKFLAPFKNTKGYLQVCLYKDGKKKMFLVHRLVAEAYIPNVNNLPQINHKDENKTHNWINNLEWCDSKYNNNYGTKNDWNKKKVRCVELNKIFESQTAASKELGIRQSCISECVNGKRKSVGGYHFEEVD